jgi:hypothetical protein
MILDNRYNQDELRMGKRKRSYVKLITWLIIGLIAYTIWFKMVPGAVEYVTSITN